MTTYAKIGAKITEVPASEIRERIAASLDTDDEIQVDNAVLSLIVDCRQKGYPVGNLPSAVVSSKMYTTHLLPITFFSIDDCDREAFIFEHVEFAEDFGPFKKGDIFESLHLSIDGGISAWRYNVDYIVRENEPVSCETRLVVVS